MNLSTLYIEWSFLGVGLDISPDLSPSPNLVKICYSRFQGFKVLFAMITYNVSDLIKKIQKNCKKGEEAHKETIRAYGAMGFLKLD